jgi:hypothetical protein
LLLRRLLVAVPLRLVRHVVPYSASADGSDGAMASHMSGDPANGRAFQAPLRVRGRCAQGQQTTRHNNDCFHCVFHVNSPGWP